VRVLWAGGPVHDAADQPAETAARMHLLSVDGNVASAEVVVGGGNWLSEPSLVYPVTIDPSATTITTHTGTGVKDTWINEADTFTSCGFGQTDRSTWQFLDVGEKWAFHNPPNCTNTGAITRTYLQFDLSGIPSSAVISSALMGLYNTDANAAGTCG